jgi:hypothetical protein
VTVVVAVVTTDGLVLASDSATTQTMRDAAGVEQVTSIWNSANKIVNLRKSWPIGAMTFGRAGFEGRMISTHTKDLRARLDGRVVDPALPALDPASYTVETVAQAVHSYFRPLFDKEPDGAPLGFLVGGYGADSVFPEVWQIMIQKDPKDDKVEQVNPPGETGIFHQGMTDAISRLVDGVAQATPLALQKMGVAKKQSEDAAEQMANMLTVPMAWGVMPLGESVDLARFLVDMTINFVRFAPGALAVGGPVEIAALTRHEGFKWVERKHYYPPRLNPVEELAW